MTISDQHVARKGSLDDDLPIDAVGLLIVDARS